MPEPKKPKSTPPKPSGGAGKAAPAADAPTARDEVRYNPQEIESRWAARWNADPALYAAEPPSCGKKKYYVVEMLPYPSGDLHMGHVRNYSIGDALARYMWMNGCNVLHPMGWDSFGLPAENAAIKNKRQPKEWTLSNIANMRQQMKRIGFSYDWSKEVTTCLPEYYRWNQWFFLKLYEKGLVYRKKGKVNWCPECATVLANEQAKNGFCWRHESTPVEQRDLEQWYARITEYADELHRDITKLGGWPESVRKQQYDWVGRSEGALVDFTLEGAAGTGSTISVFTTRVDTIFGATSIQLAPEHPLASDLVGGDAKKSAGLKEMLADQAKARQNDVLGTMEKRGFFTGRYALNPYNGERVPIWVANYILMDYGTGAIMSVPAHDERDYEFAQKYGLEIRVVIQPRGASGPPALPFTVEEEGEVINSGEFTGLPVFDAQQKMAALAERQGFGKATITFRIKDWGISRQRYWGTPIPMIYCESCGVVPVPENLLPVILPDDVEIAAAGGSPLSHVKEFVNVKCPKCGKPARRETDTMDTFVDSSWYFYRYTSPIATAPFDSAVANYWFSIDQYIGGAEHAVLHLIYSRFWTKFMRDIGLVKNDEPATRLFTQGMVIKDGAKMSKNLGNTVSPDEMVARYGADATRLYTLFAAPPDQQLDWQDKGVEGISRFLGRVYRYVVRNARPAESGWNAAIPADLPPAARNVQRKMHQTIRRITDDFDGRWHFNTSIAAMMELVNELYAAEDQSKGEVPLPLLADVQRTLALLLAPFAPYLAAELWTMLGEDASTLLRHPWPKFDPALAAEEEIEVAVQINGKLRGRVVVAVDASEDTVRAAALADDKVVQALAGRPPLKVIVVKGKLANIVVK